MKLKKIENLGKICSNKCKLYFFEGVYISIYLFLFFCICLRISSDAIFTKKNDQLMDLMSVEMPGPFIPNECD